MQIASAARELEAHSSAYIDLILCIPCPEFSSLFWFIPLFVLFTFLTQSFFHS